MQKIPAEFVACPYPCGWQKLHSAIVKNAAQFAIETISDEFPERIRKSGITSGNYALELCKILMKLNEQLVEDAL